jgi:hypothetical protein
MRSESTQVIPTIGVGGLGGSGSSNGRTASKGFRPTHCWTKIISKHTVQGGLMWRRDNNWNIAGWGYGVNFGGGLTANPVTGHGGAGPA